MTTIEKVCGTCKEWRKSYSKTPENYNCRYNGPWGSCHLWKRDTRKHKPTESLIKEQQ